jgi:hypothetical protein
MVGPRSGNSSSHTLWLLKHSEHHFDRYRHGDDHLGAGLRRLNRFRQPATAVYRDHRRAPTFGCGDYAEIKQCHDRVLAMEGNLCRKAVRRRSLCHLSPCHQPLSPSGNILFDQDHGGVGITGSQRTYRHSIRSPTQKWQGTASIRRNGRRIQSLGIDPTAHGHWRPHKKDWNGNFHNLGVGPCPCQRRDCDPLRRFYHGAG